MSSLNRIPARRLAGASLGLVVLLLTACGGGGGAELPPPVAPSVPASATASVSAWTSFAAALPISDSAAPLDLDGVMPPLSETAEPAVI